MARVNSRSTTRAWGYSWIALVCALALHVLDEALTGFLPLYNGLITDLRASYRFIPFPTFTFHVWLGGLIVGILILLLLSPMVFSGRRPMRYLSCFLAIVMILNGLGHIGASVYWGTLAPGVYSSPVLLAAAATLLVSALRART